VALSETDRKLLDRCLSRKGGAWEEFVDRFLGLVVHVANHSAQCRSIRLTPEDREDLCAEVFLAIVKDDFRVLRHFRAQSSLATYLTVISRRVVVRELLHRQKTAARLVPSLDEHSGGEHAAESADSQVEQRVHDRDQVERLLGELEGAEAQVVRMYHLEGKSYQEISSQVGMPENSVGPTLSRARQKMRQAGAGGNGAG